MQDTLTITEHTPGIWKKIIAISVLLTAAFAAIVIVIDSTLWTGIFRMLAFAGFAVLVLSVLQIYGDDHRIELYFRDDELLVDYYQKSKKVQEEVFETNTIEQLTIDSRPKVWSVLTVSGCTKFLISFTDSPNTLCLFRIEGRDILVNESDSRKVEAFFNNHIEVINRP